MTPEERELRDRLARTQKAINGVKATLDAAQKKPATTKQER